MYIVIEISQSLSLFHSDGMRSHQIFMFESKTAREDWIREFQLAKLKQSKKDTYTTKVCTWTLIINRFYYICFKPPYPRQFYYLL